MQLEEEEVLEDLSISISQIEQQILPQRQMFTWVEFNLAESREASYVQANKVMQVPDNGQEKVSSKELHLPQENRLHQIADDIMCRYLKYGKLDSTQKIAKRTGASKRLELTEKDINYYDQDDPFIDDDEILEHNQGQKMFLPNVQFSDFNCVQGDLKVLASSQQHHERIELINSFNKNVRQEKEKGSDQKPQLESKSSTKNPDKKNKKVKPNTTTTQKSQNQLSQQDSLFLQDLFVKIGTKKEEAKKTNNKKIQKKNDKSTNKQDLQMYSSEFNTKPFVMQGEQLICNQTQIAQLLQQPRGQISDQEIVQIYSSKASASMLFQQMKKGGQIVQEAIQIDDEEENQIRQA